MRRTLLIAPAWIGDMVMMEPLVRRLRAQEPETEIHVAAPAATLAVASRMAGVARTHDWPFAHGAFDLAGRMRLARALRSYAFSRAIVLTNSWKSALVPMLARIPARRGYLGEQRYGLLNDIRKLDVMALPSMVQRFLALADEQGVAPPALQAPVLEADRARGHELRRTLNLTDPARVLALCPGAEYGEAKRWPARHFAELARHWRARGWQVWIFGGTKDVHIARAIIAAANAAQDPLCVALAGRTSLTDAVDLLACADAVASNDSGLMHVAAALGRPVLGIFGSTSEAFTPPLGARTSTISVRLPCRPCFERTCRYGHYDCLRTVLPADVSSAVAVLVDATP